MSTAVLKLAPPMSGPELRHAILAFIRGANAPAKVVLEEIKNVGEAIVQELDYDSAYNLLQIRSLGVEEEILAEEGGAISDAAFAKRLGLKSRQSVLNYRDAGKIFALPKGRRNFVYPSWQIHRRHLLPGLEVVLKILFEKKTPPASILDFFLTEAEALDGKRPLDLLRAGEIEEVTLHAQRYGDIGS